MASPEAASVVERLRLQRQATFWGNGSVKYAQVRLSDLEALLAVVEAGWRYTHRRRASSWHEWIEALDALYTPDSAEERE